MDPSVLHTYYAFCACAALTDYADTATQKFMALPDDADAADRVEAFELELATRDRFALDIYEMPGTFGSASYYFELTEFFRRTGATVESWLADPMMIELSSVDEIRAAGEFARAHVVFSLVADGDASQLQVFADFINGIEFGGTFSGHDEWSDSVESLQGLSFILAHREGELVGLVGCGLIEDCSVCAVDEGNESEVEINGKSGYLYGLAVSPSERGKGIGSALASAAAFLTRFNGVDNTVLQAHPHRAQFWTRLGYKEVASGIYRRALGER